MQQKMEISGTTKKANTCSRKTPRGKQSRFDLDKRSIWPLDFGYHSLFWGLQKLKGEVQLKTTPALVLEHE
jgi:hypothetical protein